MRSIIYIFIALTAVFSCQKDQPIHVTPPGNLLDGGKGGPINIALFSKYHNLGLKSRMFVKYADNKAPADTSLYDEKVNTMAEPGLGPHIHITGLKKGTYFVHAAGQYGGNAIVCDTVLQLQDTTLGNQDIEMYLR